MKLTTENTKTVLAIKPQVAGALTSDYVNMEKANHVLVLVCIAQANAATTAITLEQATNVSGTGSKAIAKDVPIFLVADADTSDSWVRQTNAVAYTTDAALKSKMVAFEVNAEDLDVAGGFKTLCVKLGASNAANIVSVSFLCGRLRYGVASSLITD